MKEILLTQGKVALVDDEDFEWLNQWRWYAHQERGRWYALRNVPGRKHIKMHRAVLELTDPQIKSDHKDHDGLNNQRENLRACTHQQNNLNRRPKRKSTSIYKGVYWNKRKARWHARANRTHLGYFEIEADAARAYDKAAVDTFGEFACLNFPIQ